MADGRDTPDLPRGLIDRRGTPLGKGARLPSIKGPRDLTLGGIPKRVFTPTIPVRKTSDQKQTKDEDAKPGPSDSKSKKDNDSKKTSAKPKIPAKKRDKQQNFIHTHSIFEDQGSVKHVAKASNRDPEYVGGRFSSRGASSTTNTSQKVSIKKEMKEDESSDVIDYLLRDDFLDGPQRRDKYMEPVHLPLSELNLKTDKAFTEIKEDPDGESSTGAFHHKKPSKTTDNVLEAVNKPETDSDELLFFQFPDCLPGTPSQRMQTDEDEKEEDKVPQTQTLADFSEGSVGRLVIRKSGKAQLIIGNVTMDVTMGTKCSFLQDVVSIRTTETGGSLNVLGHIKHRLVCTPDFDSMLDT